MINESTLKPFGQVRPANESQFRQYAGKLFIIFCLLHLVVWTIAQAYIYQNPPTDSVESVAWGNLWLWGYEKHPPLAAWLSASFSTIFGVVGWPIYFLSQLSIVICFSAIWRLGKQILTPEHALLGVVFLEGVNYYNLQAASFNPNVLMLPLWALVILHFYQALRYNQWRDWILLGIFSGLAMLAKYESALLLLILLAFLLTDKHYRFRLKQLQPYLTVMIAFILFLPNLIWLSLHNFDAVRYAVGEMSVQGSSFWLRLKHYVWQPTNFLLEQLGCILPGFLFFIPFIKGHQTELKISGWQLRFLFWTAVMPLLSTLILAILVHAHLVSRWGFPFFSVFGLFWIAMFKPYVTRTRIKWMFVIVITYMFMAIAGQFYLYNVRPYYTHVSNYAASFPGKTIAATVTKTWHEKFKTKLPYAAGDHQVVVNVSAFSVDKPVPFFNWSERQSPWVNQADMQKRGAVFVLLMSRPGAVQMREHIEKRYPHLIDKHIVAFQRYTKAQVAKVKIWIAFLAPKTDTN
ncbi:MAG: glycosyltransferase family 39 protein [Pseudomonadota bacterium]